MKNIIAKTLSAVLFCHILCGCGKNAFNLPDYYSRTASTEFGQAIVNGAEDYITHVKTDIETELMDGVTLLEMGFLNTNSHAMQMYIYRVELGSALIKISVPDDNTKIEKVQKLTEQALAVENKGNYLVMGGICGGTFNAETGVPSGMLYHGSKAFSSSFDKDAAFFAILKDGAAICREATDFANRKDKVTEGVSGSVLILKNGYILSETNATATAKAAVGVDDTGSTVYLAVVDGGNYFYSNGISNSDLARVLKGCGAADAMVINTGNNVSAFCRNEDSIDMFEVINTPSNMGLEQAIGNGIVILQQ